MQSQFVRLVVVVSILAFVFGLARAAGAQAITAPEPASLTPSRDRPRRLEWNRARFSTGHYVATGVLLGGFVGANLLLEDRAPRWRGGILVDQHVMQLGRADSAEGRMRASRASDYLMGGLLLWPYVDGAVAWAAHGSADAAWQMSMINTQAFALTALVSMAIKRTVRRERPFVTNECTTPESQSDPRCRDSGSFLSGHAAFAFTGAGLVCAHHENLPLYGGGVADTLACGTALAAAAATSALRVVADAHYTSDVFAGAALGLASGYLLPKILHYGGLWRTTRASDAREDRAARAKSGIVWSAMPMATPGGAMLSFSGVFF